MKSPLLFVALFFVSSLLCKPVFAQVITSAQIDQLVERTLKTFEVPGIAVAVVKDGKVIHSKGYGIRSIHSKEKVDANTLFGIASNSKAFTAATLGILIDDGKLNWDDKVVDYIPEFRLYNSYVTEDFTIRDLLTHRSGLGLGAGDLMFFPDSSDFTLKDVIHNLRYLKQVSGFRTKYDYDNLLYMVAGEVVKRASGQSWEDFVETRIMKPLQMEKSAASFSRLKDKSNVIDAHAVIEGKLRTVRRGRLDVGNSAGGINSSINDLSKWVIMQLNGGKYGDGLSKTLFSAKVQDEMWTPQTIIPVRNPGPYNTHFSAYGLGWGLSDVKGYKQVTHTGGLPGMVTQVTLLPELKLGIIVLTNQQAGAAFTSITNQIKDSYFGITGTDRVKEYSDRLRENTASADKVTDEVRKVVEAQKSAAKPDLNFYAGTYHDNWLGDVSIAVKNDRLLFAAKRSPRLTGELYFYKGNTFVVKWNDRSLEADAFVMFGLDYEGKPVSMKMKAISPLTDFSYDFHDLEFGRK
ncbi:serine hydrolase [Larkinella terrae]|uniref:Serine hydrolase n=1 Tax=Larkinella terrae TaxID=2025311 RepID=A0A7K0ELU6_9BACT|nr:serine hydrolase [Larkinella terrae]MRS62823.1 serine hydrolase [Larkinella terrae]